jgi:hypothetical protein
MTQAALTPLQTYQHAISDLLEAAAKDLSEQEKAALQTYAMMRATIELAPSTWRSGVA